jgi:hypothetical protein
MFEGLERRLAVRRHADHDFEVRVIGPAAIEGSSVAEQAPVGCTKPVPATVRHGSHGRDGA